MKRLKPEEVKEIGHYWASFGGLHFPNYTVVSVLTLNTVNMLGQRGRVVHPGSDIQYPLEEYDEYIGPLANPFEVEA